MTYTIHHGKLCVDDIPIDFYNNYIWVDNCGICWMDEDGNSHQCNSGRKVLCIDDGKYYYTCYNAGLSCVMFGCVYDPDEELFYEDGEACEHLEWDDC